MTDAKVSCPFVYANGKQCEGHIYRVRGYGPHSGDVRKYRLWCSERGDHAGAVSGYVSKERMEFYPDRLPEAVYDALSDGRLELE